MGLIELTGTLELGLIYGLVGMGLYLSFRIINFSDLTGDGSFALGACICAALLKAGWPPEAAVLGATIGGACAGGVTALLNTHLGISDVLAGIITAFALYSINLRILGGLPNVPLFDQVTLWRTGPCVIYLGLITFSLWQALTAFLKTDIGLAMRSTGTNPIAAKRYGVNTAKMTILGLCISNAMIALAGGLIIQAQGFCDISLGIGTVIIGLAALFLGEALVPLRSPGGLLFSCLIGAILYRFVIMSALRAGSVGLHSTDLNVITAILVIGLLWIKRKNT